jgi:uncharacterized membrane protein HdeD (DUF308 family)
LQTLVCIHARDERTAVMEFQAAPSKAQVAMSVARGILLVLLGLAALAAPGATAVGFTLVLAWILMLGGLTHLLTLWHASTLLGAARSIAIGLLYFAAGLVLLRQPVWAVTSLTVVIGLVLLAEGVIGVIAYVSGDHRTGSELLTAIVALALGAMVINGWPLSSVWAIGTVVGVNLLVAGVAETFAIGRRHSERLGHT